ncbi:UDP-N-acetylmuramoylalanyl-D-glutamate--2,6-diaminopimelate ligase [Paenibacillus sp. 32O-W]|uniref:UDP-N-acetylmuramoyl-L-alanyl-D-glutamate--2, 6-diaminopimelate ligase n=1 Tax=Paenibacillus sp. 32O-W TaxID=1695218 RepID=UPI000720213E|nr:UDP-N-acetylmuramoyl-L-alanyl-D-glutamate--2,6-diaminopimelate ligase [Paenibacillus sp. 32O-W]ALS28366.1 UDP-N-acetylmuramoylalanyl-D-glutamate--2,6-diaminopimelate ligase [Paenibacillus sp. 32O-W]
MKLSSLIRHIPCVQLAGQTDPDIADIQFDSRKAGKGTLFVCVPGLRTDGHLYAREAVSRGAAALLVERPVDIAGTDAAVIQVSDIRNVMARLAVAFYGDPTRELKVIGVTGTNGKTTTTHMIRHLLEHAGRPAGIIGTLGVAYGDFEEKTANTTPESVDLQRYMRLMADRGAAYAVIEASSQALAMGRMNGCRRHLAVFTNLTRDHLDYHSTLKAYADCKAKLFDDSLSPGAGHPIAVVNADDPASGLMVRASRAEVIRYGIRRRADVRAVGIRSTDKGMAFAIAAANETFEVELPLFGMHNVYNALAASAAALREGLSPAEIREALSGFRGVKGRYQFVRAGQPYRVIVDYAHNPDGLKKLLQTAREHGGKLISVVGCEGDKDKGKRPVMARIAAQYSDRTIFTTDNPHSEDPIRILSDMYKGLDHASCRSKAVIIPDRREAIACALDTARQDPDYSVVIAGKGHETRQWWHGTSIPFDDAEVAAETIRRLEAENAAVVK